MQRLSIAYLLVATAAVTIRKAQESGKQTV
jgi:hypothetical protein